MTTHTWVKCKAPVYRQLPTSTAISISQDCWVTNSPLQGTQYIFQHNERCLAIWRRPQHRAAYPNYPSGPATVALVRKSWALEAVSQSFVAALAELHNPWQTFLSVSLLS